MVTRVTRTTLTLPADLLARVDIAVRQGHARSRNSFVAAALERDLAAQERAELDAEFAGMAQDDDYLAESAQLDAEFAAAGAEALHLADGRA
jgi:metal-responsive CopG/Arc/MetJ family transcriptional regulator